MPELFPLLGFIELKTLLLIFHVLGVALGAGVAFASAIMFTKVMHDGVATKNEMEFLDLASRVVGVGLVLLIASGVGLFLTDPETYMNSSKFLAKMTVVAILVINGPIIHTFHIPVLKRNLGKNLKQVHGFNVRSSFMYVGGAISMTSWTTALTLGVFRGVPYSYEVIILLYGAVLAVAAVTAFLLKQLTFSRIRSE